MRQDRSSEAQQALDTLSEGEVREVLGLLVRHRPEAVLQACSDLRRHQAVLEQLRGGAPAAHTPSQPVYDDRGQVADLGGYVPRNP